MFPITLKIISCCLFLPSLSDRLQLCELPGSYLCFLAPAWVSEWFLLPSPFLVAIRILGGENIHTEAFWVLLSLHFSQFFKNVNLTEGTHCFQTSQMPVFVIWVSPFSVLLSACDKIRWSLLLLSIFSPRLSHLSEQCFRQSERGPNSWHPKEVRLRLLDTPTWPCGPPRALLFVCGWHLTVDCFPFLLLV